MEKEVLLKELIDKIDKEKWPPADDALTRRNKERPAQQEIEIPVARLKMVTETTLKVRVPRAPITTPDRAVALFRKYFEDADREIVAIITMDGQNNLLNIWTVAIGGINHVHVDPAEVFKRVLATDNAAAFIPGHNHPDSGDPTPSDADFEMMDDLQRLGIALNRPMIDFIVIGAGDRYYRHGEGNYIR